MVVGPYTRAIKSRPDLPPGGKEDCLIALPKVASKNADKIYYLLCSDKGEFGWVERIVLFLENLKNDVRNIHQTFFIWFFLIPFT